MVIIRVQSGVILKKGRVTAFNVRNSNKYNYFLNILTNNMLIEIDSVKYEFVSFIFS